MALKAHGSEIRTDFISNSEDCCTPGFPFVPLLSCVRVESRKLERLVNDARGTLEKHFLSEPIGLTTPSVPDKCEFCHINPQLAEQEDLAAKTRMTRRELAEKRLESLADRVVLPTQVNILNRWSRRLIRIRPRRRPPRALIGRRRSRIDASESRMERANATNFQYRRHHPLL